MATHLMKLLFILGAKPFLYYENSNTSKTRKKQLGRTRG